MNVRHKILTMNYSGRIIDQLGIQMYQSPVAAIAELISNSWDADAEKVKITLPAVLEDSAKIIINDDGLGMKFEDCQKKYLNVGYCRRGNSPTERSKEKNRPILGRKGIGKFAGFGIAEKITVETISKETGEKIVFELDLNSLREGEYVTTGHRIDVLEYLGPDQNNTSNHGTKIILGTLTFERKPSESVFLRSMARRFLLHRRASDFKVLINSQMLPQKEEEENIEFIFPRDYREQEKPADLEIENDWGIERLVGEKTIKWQICFYKKPIDEEELRGVSIFSHGKMAQTPFFFNLTGGLGGQHGQEYITGMVEADYLDELEKDIIAPERQRIDFKNPQSLALEDWGKEKLKSLFRLWRDRRGEKKLNMLEEKIAPFSQRLNKLSPHERKIIKRAVVNLAKIPALEESEFFDLGNSILTSWEGGRLKELISEMAESDSMNEVDFLHALIETGVLTALNIAEAVKTKMQAIVGLKNHIEKRTLENPLRDFIAANPWLIAPEWETFVIERSVKGVLESCARNPDVKFCDTLYKGRIDLALRSGDHLLVLEFMKPGLPLDFDHLNRFDIYINQIDEEVMTLTSLGINRVSGYLVADNLTKKSGLRKRIQEMKEHDKLATDWDTLLKSAVEKYREYLEILQMRAPKDDRLKVLLT